MRRELAHEPKHRRGANMNRTSIGDSVDKKAHLDSTRQNTGKRIKTNYSRGS